MRAWIIATEVRIVLAVSRYEQAVKKQCLRLGLVASVTCPRYAQDAVPQLSPPRTQQPQHMREAPLVYMQVGSGSNLGPESG